MCRTDDVLERHVDDRRRDERLDERRKPQRVGREIERRGDERDRVRQREGRDHDQQRRQPAERDHEAEQEEQVIDAVQDMEKAQRDEASGGLVPAWIQADESGIAGQLERALRARRRHESQDGDDLHAQPRQRRLDRERRSIRRDVGYSNSTSIIAWVGTMRVSAGGPVAVTWLRAPANDSKERSDGSDTRAAIRRAGGEPPAVFVDGQAVADPQRRGVAERGVGVRDVEHAIAERREHDVAHRGDRGAHDDARGAARRGGRRRARPRRSGGRAPRDGSRRQRAPRRAAARDDASRSGGRPSRAVYTGAPSGETRPDVESFR